MPQRTIIPQVSSLGNTGLLGHHFQGRVVPHVPSLNEPLQYIQQESYSVSSEIQFGGL